MSLNAKVACAGSFSADLKALDAMLLGEWRSDDSTLSLDIDTATGILANQAGRTWDFRFTPNGFSRDWESMLTQCSAL